MCLAQSHRVIPASQLAPEGAGWPRNTRPIQVVHLSEALGAARIARRECRSGGRFLGLIANLHAKEGRAKSVDIKHAEDMPSHLTCTWRMHMTQCTEIPIYACMSLRRLRRVKQLQLQTRRRHLWRPVEGWPEARAARERHRSF